MITALSDKRGPVAAAILATCILAACGGPDEGPEAAVRAWVAQGHEAARGEQVSGRGGVVGGGGYGLDAPSLHVNRSAGTIMVRHFPDVLDEAQKRALLEYLKTL